MKLNTAIGAMVGTIIGLVGTQARAQDTAEQANQTPAPGTPVVVQMPDGTYHQGYAMAAVEPAAEPAPKQFAITTNPLNLYIHRYGLNLEYQPTLHHGVIVSPHYDSVSVDATGIVNDNGTTQSFGYKDSFSGFGAEIGYRFYSGNRGFNGFFAGPSLLLATYKTSGNLQGANIESSFSSIGWAWEVGGQAQLGGGFIIGGGGGMQYTKVSKKIEDLPIAAAIIAGGGWRPRFLFNLGYAF
jgi:hypothetical protein